MFGRCQKNKIKCANECATGYNPMMSLLENWTQEKWNKKLVENQTLKQNPTLKIKIQNTRFKV